MITPVKPLLIAVGDNCLDAYLTKGHLAVGGNALNVAVQWHRQGHRARYFGAVGADAEGELIRHAIAAAGLDLADLEWRPGQTAVTLLRERDGDRRFLLEDLGVGRHYLPEPERLAQLEAADWLHLGTNSSAELLRDLIARGVPFSLDVSTDHDRLDLSGVPLVFASGPEDPASPIEPLMQGFLGRGARRVVVTCGSRGAFFHDGQVLHRVAAQPVAVVDTCGAGDSFISRFLVEYMVLGAPAGLALERATATAARTCMHLGGFPQPLQAIPDWLLRKYAETIATAENGHDRVRAAKDAELAQRGRDGA